MIPNEASLQTNQSSQQLGRNIPDFLTPSWFLSAVCGLCSLVSPTQNLTHMPQLPAPKQARMATKPHVGETHTIDFDSVSQGG